MKYLVSNSQTLFSYDNIERASVLGVLLYFKDISVISLDTETTGLDPHCEKIILLQLADEKNQYVIDALTVDISRFKELLEDKSKTFIIQNAKFDLQMFYRHNIVITRVFDTFLAETLLFLGYPSNIVQASLAALAFKYLGVTLDKSVRTDIDKKGLTQKVIDYSADDVKYLIQIAKTQYSLLKEKDLLKAFSFENKFVVALAYTEYCGIKLDISKWRAKMWKDTIRLSEAKKKLDNWIIENHPEYIDKEVQLDLFRPVLEQQLTFSWSSPKQLIPIFQKLGFNLDIKNKKTKKISQSVGANVIKNQKHISPIANLYLEFKQAEKVVSTYGETFIDSINPVSKRIHTSFKQLQSTGRLSSGKDDEDEEDSKKPNLQNIPADADTRACFVAEEGNVLIDADYTA